MECVNFPQEIQEFNEPPYLGSFQQLLSQNIGKTVKIDFQYGINNSVSQTGVVAAVGLSYVILEQAGRNTFLAGDMYSIKFITFLCC